MKKILCVVILLCMVGGGYAQKTKRKAPKTVGEESIEMILLQKTQDFLDGFDFSIGTPAYRGMEKKPQFFLEEKSVETFIGIKPQKAEMKKTFLAMQKKKSGIAPPESSFRVQEGSARKKQDGVPDSKKKAKDTAIKACWTTQAEAHIRAQKGEEVSDAKFGITFTWVVNKKTNAVEDDLLDMEVLPIRYLASEKQEMLETAKKKILEHYTQQNVAEIFSSDSVVFPSLSPTDITLRENKGTYESTKVPEVDIYIMDDDEPTAIYKLKPSFVVDFGGDVKVHSVKWNPCDTTPFIKSEVSGNKEVVAQEPVKEEKQDDPTRKQELAKAFAKNFSTELIAYAKNPTPAGKHLVENMFISHFINIVEVSHISASTPEVIVQRFVKDYLARLRTSDIKIEIDFDGVKWSEDGQRVVFPFRQVFTSATYKDFVVKELHMKAVGELWYAEGVTVVPHTTRMQK